MRISRVFLCLAMFLSLFAAWDGAVQAQRRMKDEANAESGPRVWFETGKWVRYGDPVVIRFEKGSSGAAIASILVQKRESAESDWSDYRTLAPQPGQTQSELYVSGDAFMLRARAEDANGEQSPWVESEPINKYNTLVEIEYADHRGRALPVVDPHISSQNYAYDPVWQWVDEEKQRAYAYIRSYYGTTVAPELPGYGSWGVFHLFSYAQFAGEGVIPPTATIPIYMPPLDDQMQEAGDADLPYWEVMGRGMLQIQSHYSHANRFHLYTPLDKNPSYICPLWEFIDVDANALNQPTLSLYYSTNIPHLTVVWQRRIDGEFVDIATLPPHAPARSFRYAWVDMTPARGEPGRPCFRFQGENVQNPYFRFDSVALGSTRSNLSLRLLSQSPFPATGETTTLTFAITNHSPYTATARLTIDLTGRPRSEQLLPVMKAGELITASVEVQPPAGVRVVPYTATVGELKMDDSPEDNVVKRALIVNPERLYLPRYISPANPGPQPGGER